MLVLERSQVIVCIIGELRDMQYISQILRCSDFKLYDPLSCVLSPIPCSCCTFFHSICCPSSLNEMASCVFQHTENKPHRLLPTFLTVSHFLDHEYPCHIRAFATIHSLPCPQLFRPLSCRSSPSDLSRFTFRAIPYSKQYRLHTH